MWKYRSGSALRTCPYFTWSMSRNILQCTLMFYQTKAMSSFTGSVCIPSSTAIRREDTTQMPTGIKLSLSQSLKMFQLPVATWPQNLMTIILLLMILWGRHWSMAHLCSVWCCLGGTTVDDGSKMASLTCLAVGASYQRGSLISPPNELWSSRASLSPCGLLAE